MDKWNYPIKQTDKGYAILWPNGEIVGKYHYPAKWKAEIYRDKILKKDKKLKRRLPDALTKERAAGMVYKEKEVLTLRYYDIH